MPNNKSDSLVHHAVGYGDRLFGIADVIHFNGNQFFTHHAAIGVNLFNGHAGAGELHVAVLGYRAGHRAGNTNLDFSVGLTSGHQGNGGAYSGNDLLGRDFHRVVPVCVRVFSYVLKESNKHHSS